MLTLMLMLTLTDSNFYLPKDGLPPSQDDIVIAKVRRDYLHRHFVIVSVFKGSLTSARDRHRRFGNES